LRPKTRPKLKLFALTPVNTLWWTEESGDCYLNQYGLSSAVPFFALMLMQGWTNDGFIQCAMTCDIYIYQKSQRHAPLLMAEMTMQLFDTVVTLINHQALTTGCL
jgi:hypothetical protein